MRSVFTAGSLTCLMCKVGYNFRMKLESCSWDLIFVKILHGAVVLDLSGPRVDTDCKHKYGMRLTDIVLVPWLAQRRRSGLCSLRLAGEY
ncbi:hypothetical protein Prudu_015960 [Prunus dulcis]|uniref:Uncharacterized protein n=1 Tax=Prunus dulcis TaxID=3755 RepID=A0A4Y1RM48_PRUDU|nr:hypothetical protein Prudu_015960 [Prunus dulcis]